MFIIPLIGMLIIALLPFETLQEKERGKKIGLLFSLLTLFESIRMWISFDNNSPDFQYTMEIFWSLNQLGEKGI